MIQYELAASTEQYQLIEDLGKIIWTEHYTPIIGIEQVNYMLQKFQSAEVILNQIKEGYKYFIIRFQNEPIGYISVIKDKQSLFLSKLYIHKDFRGRKFGKQALSYIQDLAIELDCASISLTVNKYNSKSIKAYERMGFENVEALIIDIGGGFIMDDYKLTKRI